MKQSSPLTPGSPLNHGQPIALNAPATDVADVSPEGGGHPPLRPFSRFRERLRSGGRGPEMVALPPGRFRMGSGARSCERPAVEVRIRRPFALAVCAVPFELYDQFAEATGRAAASDRGWGRGAQPAIHVSWADAVAFCEGLSVETGGRYRLPSEAEWEYACRAEAETRFACGDVVSSDVANFDGATPLSGAAIGPSHGRPAPVDAECYAPNAWGFRQMHGNVGEWCADLWAPTHHSAEPDGAPRRIGDPGGRVVRGGSWVSFPWDATSASRARFPVGFRGATVGFRVARDLDAVG